MRTERSMVALSPSDLTNPILDPGALSLGSFFDYKMR